MSDADRLKHLTAIRDARQNQPEAQQRIYNRTCKVKQLDSPAISDDEMDTGVLVLMDARIALAEAEIALLDAQKGSQ